MAFKLKALLALGSPEKIAGSMLDGGEVGRGVFGANAAFVIAKGHVHDPVQTIFNTPVIADKSSKISCGCFERGDIVTHSIKHC